MKGVGSSFKSPLQQLPPSRLSLSTEEEVQQLQDKLKTVTTEIKELQDLGCTEEELKVHIDKLHQYNEIKDIGQMVLGRIANLEGVRTKDLYEKYGLELND